MRIDFNQQGGWRKGPDFDARDIELVKEAAEKLADMTDAKLRILGETGEVVAYRDLSNEGCCWRESKTRGQS